MKLKNWMLVMVALVSMTGTVYAQQLAPKNEGAVNAWSMGDQTAWSVALSLLSKAEWETIIGSDNWRLVTINDETVKGLVVYPSTWAGEKTGSTENYDTPVDNWATLEAGGARFLPLSGATTTYWTSTPMGDEFAYVLTLNATGSPLVTIGNQSKSSTAYVRLKQEGCDCFTVTTH